MFWGHAIAQLADCLDGLCVTDRDGAAVTPDKGFATLCTLTEALRSSARTLFLVGNGASASMASHVAADLAKNGHVHTEVFSDLSLITAMANDIGYDHVFAGPLARRMHTGDMLVGISSSGNSPNVVKAVLKARELGGLAVTLTAMGGDNRLRGLGDLNFWVPGATYGLAETAHAAILHHWIDRIVEGCGE